jgi:hypothetical protein
VERYCNSLSLLGRLQQFSNTHLRAVSCLLAVVRLGSRRRTDVGAVGRRVVRLGSSAGEALEMDPGTVDCSSRGAKVVGLPVAEAVEQQAVGSAATSVLESGSVAFWAASEFSRIRVFLDASRGRFLTAFLRRDPFSGEFWLPLGTLGWPFLPVAS